MLGVGHEGNTIGVIEADGYANAVVLLRAVGDVLPLRLLSLEKKLGGRLVVAVFAGDRASVEAGMAAARAFEAADGGDYLKTAIVIGNPHPEVARLFRWEESDGKQE
jgi:microcompartment protein CcmL/EutN